MLNEFKDFINRGNVVELAVGLVIGAAFGVVIKSLVDDLVMPIVGLFLGGVSFADMFIVLGDGEFGSLAAAREAGANVFAYGNFITVLLTFLITAFAVFLVARSYNKMKDRFEAEEEAAAPAEPPKNEVLLEEIRDLLKKSS